MRYRILKNGDCINTILADEDFVSEYCEKNDYTFEHIPEPEPEPDPQPTAEEDRDAMLVDHEYRLTLLELGVTEGV